MFRQVIGRMFSGGELSSPTESFHDCCARSVDMIPEGGLPYGHCLLIFDNSGLKGVFDQPPPQTKRSDEQWWLVPNDDINLSIPWREESGKGSIEIATRLEAESELLKLIGKRRIIATRDLQQLVSEELSRLLRNGDDLPTSLADIDGPQRETLRARLSLSLQTSGVRCTSIGKFVPRSHSSDAAAGWDVVSDQGPRLSVRWNGMLVAGWEVSPEVRIVCPEGFVGRPVVDAWIDSRLDQPMRGAGITPVRLDETTWSFELFASLTKDGAACSPGTYRIRVAVRVLEAPPGQSRYFTGSIALQVLPDKVDDPANSEVRLKTEAFPLVVDEERERSTPRVSPAFAAPTPVADSAIVFADGRRLLLRGETSARLGRERTNEIVTRFLPRSKENDQLTASLSRQHVAFDLRPEGLRVCDLNSTLGTTLNRKRLTKPTIVPASVGSVELGLGDHPGVSPYFCVLKMFSESASPGYREMDADVCEALNITVPAQWSLARRAGLSAVKVEPQNQVDADPVLLVYHEAMLGSAPQCAIPVSGAGVAAHHARLLQINGAWWLLNLSRATRLNDKPINELDLTALTPDMSLTLGSTTLRFESP